MLTTDAGLSVHRALDNALNACTLTHFPPQLYHVAELGCTQSLDEFPLYVLREPKYGDGVRALENLFTAESDIADAPTFDHPLVNAASEEAGLKGYPMFGTPVSAGFASNPKGLIKGDTVDRYLLVTRNENNLAVGFVEFDIRIEHCVERSDTSKPEADIRRVGLSLHLRQFYVRKLFRRRGAASATALLLADRLALELAGLIDGLADATRDLGQPLTICPGFEMHFNSRSSAMVHSLLATNIGDVVAEARATCSNKGLLLEDLRERVR
jgi:hypothetical protein